MRLPYIVATVLYCAFLFSLSADSDPPKFEFPWQIMGLDKVIHAVLEMLSFKPKPLWGMNLLLSCLVTISWISLITRLFH